MFFSISNNHPLNYYTFIIDILNYFLPGFDSMGGFFGIEILVSFLLFSKKISVKSGVIMFFSTKSRGGGRAGRGRYTHGFKIRRLIKQARRGGAQRRRGRRRQHYNKQALQSALDKSRSKYLLKQCRLKGLSKKKKIKKPIKPFSFNNIVCSVFYNGLESPITWWYYIHYLRNSGWSLPQLNKLLNLLSFDSLTDFFSDVDTLRLKILISNIHILLKRNSIFIRKKVDGVISRQAIHPLKSPLWTNRLKLMYLKQKYNAKTMIHNFDMYLRLHPIGWDLLSSLYTKNHVAALHVFYEETNKKKRRYWKLPRPPWYFKRNRNKRILTYLKKQRDFTKLKYLHRVLTIHFCRQGTLNLKSILDQQPTAFYNNTRYEGFLTAIYLRVVQLLRIVGCLPFFTYFIITKFISQAFTRVNGQINMNLHKVLSLYDLLELSYYGLFMFMGLFSNPIIGTDVRKTHRTNLWDKNCNFIKYVERLQIFFYNFTDKNIYRILHSNIFGKLKVWLFNSINLFSRILRYYYTKIRWISYQVQRLVFVKNRRFFRKWKDSLVYSKLCLAFIPYTILSHWRSRLLLPFGFKPKMVDFMLSFTHEK